MVWLCCTPDLELILGLFFEISAIKMGIIMASVNLLNYFPLEKSFEHTSLLRMDPYAYTWVLQGFCRNANICNLQYALEGTGMAHFKFRLGRSKLRLLRVRPMSFDLAYSKIVA